MAFTKYVKNNTGAAVTYVGVTINAGAYYLIQAQEDNNFSTDPTVLADVASTSAIMARDTTGSNDISDISEAIDFLKNNITKVVIEGVDIVSNAIAVNAAVSVTSASPTYSKKARIILSKPDQALPRQNQTHYTAFTYTGSGQFANFILDLNSENIELVCEVDGEEIFDADIKELKDMYDEAASYRTWLSYDKKKKTVSFSPEYPIAYATSVIIKARANSNNNGRKLERIMVDLTKET